MDDPRDKATNLNHIFVKLGHEIEEIRCRALTNLLCKLEHRLIEEADLVQEHHLLIRLLEWFNFKSCPQKKDVLLLIQRLAKHPSASEHLVKIGAVQFLSQLRQDIEDNLQASIDDILELLLSLPGEVTSSVSYEHCFYEAQTTGHNGDVIQDASSIPKVSPRSLTLTPDMANGYFHLGLPSPTGALKNKSRRAILQEQCPGSKGICGVIFSTFPWLPLTATDVHVLSSTNNSLCSSDVQVVITSCDFINDVVLHDFPAEIFLQRPNIIQSLLSLLADHRQDDESKARVTQHAVYCLTNISILLMARFQFYHDPALYCPKQEFLSRTNSTTSSVGGEQSHSTIQSTLSSESRPSIIGRTNRRVSGDGRDWDSHSSVGSSPILPGSISPPAVDPETDSDDTIVLQFSQMTLPQFTLDAMLQALNLLKTSSLELTSPLVHLLHRAFRLLSVAMTADIWQDKSVSGRLLTDKLSECLESMGSLIHHHHQMAHCGHMTSHMTSQQQMHHVQTYQVLATFTLAVINKFAPLSKAQDLIPEELSTALGMLLIDAGFNLVYPECIKNLQCYVASVSPEQDSVNSDMDQIISSMQSACALMKGRNSLELHDQVELAQSACLAWSYYGMADIIQTLVQCSSDICRRKDDTVDVDDKRACRLALLHYLAHPDGSCRSHTYRACLQIIKDSLKVAEAVHPRSEVSQRVTFLLDPSILHEIACYGLDDSNQEVQEMSESILLTLLQGRLLMSQALWDTLLQAFIPIMPLLQAHASSHPAVSECANDLINKCRDPAVFGSYARLPALEQIRGGLRMLFSKDFRVRADASSALLWHLVNEPEAEMKRPILSPPPSGIEELFVFHTKASLDNHNGMSVFQEDGLLQVLNIFTSENTERDLKKSALQQMAIILQDSRLHHTFVSHGGLEKIMETLATIIIPTAQSLLTCDLVPPLVSILRHLVHANTARRRKISHQSGLYLMLLRASLICRGSEEARQEIAHLITLLIFDETITMATDGQDNSRKACFPLVITQHFQLPFRCGITSSARPHRLTPRPSPDPMRLSENWSRLKLEWMKAWTIGQDGLIQALLHDDKRMVEYSSNLLLEPEERALLATSYPPTCLRQSLQTILAATSHFTVKQAICQLSLMKHWASLQQKRGVNEGGEMSSLTRALLGFDWKAALNRFLEVVPANSEDEQLLAHLLSLLSQLLRSPDLVTPDLIEWVGSTCSGGKLSLVELLGKYPPAGQMGEGQTDGGKGKEGSQALVRKEILRLLTGFVQNLPLSQDAWRRRGMFLGGSLVHGLLGSLDLADALHFYDLPSLESTLHCLVHVTARPGWSLDWADGDSLTLCQQMLKSLQEVVSAFHVGRGGTAMSYMGKGVTKSATLCLLHLTREMAARAVDKSWPMDWLYTSKGSSEPGFSWLTPLLSYRDPEVRAAGLGIAASLASSEQGCVAIATCFQQRTGGVWGLALSVLLDHSECSVVRQQAASFLANLLLQPFKSDDPPKGQKSRHSDNQQKIGIAGLSAVSALLQYHRFFPEVATMFTHYYPDATIQPISIVEDSTLPSSSTQSGPPTLTTPDSSENEGSVRPSQSGGQRSQDDRARTHLEMRSPEGHSISSQDTVSSSSSGITVGRFESVVTPGLVTSTTCLLANLLAVIPSDAVHAVTKENILQTLQGLINVNRIQSLLQEATPSSSSADHTPLPTDPRHSPKSHYASQVQLCRQTSMCAAVLRLYLACLQQDTPTLLDALHDGKLIAKCCRLLAIQLPEQGDTKLLGEIHELWRISFEFLTTLAHLSGLEHLNSLLGKSWNYITDCIISVVSKPSPASTRITALNFLSTILTKAEQEEETRRSSTRSLEEGYEEAAAEGRDEKSLLAGLLDERKDQEGTSTGNELGETLLKAYDGSLPRSTGPGLAQEKPAVFSALKVLLSISDTAKNQALAAGLVETTVDTLKQIHAKLTLESLHMDKTGAKKKEDPLFIELHSSFDLLNSIMVNSHDVKMAAHQAGLGVTIHKLWAWLGLDVKLMMTTLLLLTTYTARCPVVCAAVASCGPGQTGNSILHYLIRLVERERLKVEKGSESDMLAQVFSILGNLVWYGECRNVLWKSGFLGSFIKVKLPRSSKQTKNAASLHTFAALWLQLLTNLTFATEGQQMIMRIPDALDLLIDFAQCPVSALQDSALLVLHNLCYLAANKTRLVANDKLVRLFLTTLTDGCLKTQFTVTSALYALIYDSQKAKALLKTSRLSLSLQELEMVLQKEMQRPQPPATLIEATRRDMATRCQFVTSAIAALLQE
ncbi:rotatin-like isoform X2 [Lytechinus variegatus]|uniref:rotatin-like isoform X2 n=1 Tax=Lytechinus variegatus TaxID=7654 RepID=UPI001BB11B3C|nr:rotatin-like isoform X2 [Lytechinus variegatus]XP_041454794.1 rotatin-like isoform X2 [Lytechinus variegatus]